MKRFVFAVFAIAVFAGCERRDTSSLPPNSFTAMKGSEVLVRVGDKTLTKQMVLDNISGMQKLAQHRSGGQANERRDMVIARNVRKNVFNQFCKTELVLSVTSTNGVSYSSAELEAARASFYTNFAVKGEALADVRNLLSEGERAFIERVAESKVALEAYLNKNCAGKLEVTEEEITNALARAKAWNDMVDATNRYAYAMASNIVKWAAQGQDFGKLADKYSADPEKKPGGLIDDHAAVSFSSATVSYLDTLDQMPAGKVSDILPSIEGLLIVKALGKNDKGVPQYQRIVLLTGEKYPTYTREEIRRMGADELKTKFINEFLSETGKRVKIEYPHGEDLFGTNR